MNYIILYYHLLNIITNDLSMEFILDSGYKESYEIIFSHDSEYFDYDIIKIKKFMIMRLKIEKQTLRL